MLVAVLMDEVGVMCEQIGLFKCVNMSVSKWRDVQYTSRMLSDVCSTTHDAVKCTVVNLHTCYCFCAPFGPREPTPIPLLPYFPIFYSVY